VAPETKLRLEAVLVGGEAELLEARDLALGERVVTQVGQSGPAPQGERLAKQVGGLAERAAAQGGIALLRELFEALGVELPGVDAQPVGGPLPGQAVGNDLAQLRDVDLERVGGRGGRLLAPEVLDQELGRNRLVPVQEEQRQQRARLFAFDRERGAVQLYLDRAENPVLQWDLQRGKRIVPRRVSASLQDLVGASSRTRKTSKQPPAGLNGRRTGWGLYSKRGEPSVGVKSSWWEGAGPP